MKLLKIGLRFWITLTSVFSFLVGWAMLAHAPKPVQPVSTQASLAAPLPTLAPLDFSNAGGGIQPQQFSVIQSPAQNFFSSMPVFNTGGS